MDETNKKTSTRRRRGGGPRQPGRKNYASEGDVLSEMPMPVGYPAGYPATPSKSNMASPAPGSHQAHSKSTTKKNPRKGRPDNVSTTPGPLRSGRGTPPQSASACESAFAGSSHFNNSPAPEFLPMPKFALKRSESVGMRPTQEQSPPASDCETPSPSQPTTLMRSKTDETPLSFLFNAQRAEQERKQKLDMQGQAQRSHSGNPPTGFEDGPFSAPSELQTAQNLHNFNDRPVPFKLPTRPAQRGVSDNNGSSRFAMRPEAFAMPIHERIRAARALEHHTPQQQHPQPRHLSEGQQPQNLSNSPLLDKSEQMKRLLGIGAPAPSPQFVSTPVRNVSTAPVSSSPGLNSPSRPQATGNPAGSPRPSDADDMKKRGEDALRQVLGLKLNNFFPISSGLDGNNSPQPRPGYFPEST